MICPGCKRRILGDREEAILGLSITVSNLLNKYNMSSVDLTLALLLAATGRISAREPIEVIKAIAECFQEDVGRWDPEEGAHELPTDQYLAEGGCVRYAPRPLVQSHERQLHEGCGLGGSCGAIGDLLLRAFLLAQGESDDPFGLLHSTLECFRVETERKEEIAHDAN